MLCEVNSLAKNLITIVGLSVFCCPLALGQQLTPRIEKDRLDALLAKYDRPGKPGGALLVLKEGKTAYSKAFGLASVEHGVRNSLETVFSLDYGECREFTALAVAMLAEEGALSLNDSARNYVPELPEFAAAIKLRDLIHNASGLFDYGQQFLLTGWMLRNPLSDEDFFRLLRRQRLTAFPPGTDFMYSNTDYALLAFAVQRATGKSLRQQADRLLFKPLGMNSTLMDDRFGEVVTRRAYEYFDADGAMMMKRRDKFSPSGRNGVLTTVGDLKKWADALENPRSKLAKVAKSLRIGAVFDPNRNGEYNFGHFVGQSRGLQAVWHQGISQSPYLVRFPDHAVTIAYLGNGGPDAQEVLKSALDQVFFGGPDPSRSPVKATPKQLEEWSAALKDRPKSVIVTDEELRTFAGGYRRMKGSRGRDFICEVRDQSLAEIFGNEVEPMMALGNGVFFHLNCFLVFEPRDKAGSVRLRAFSKTGELVEEMTRIPSVVWPDTAELTELVGDYYNYELDVTWSIFVSNGKLALKRERMGDVAFFPSAKDRYLLSVIADPESYSYDVELRINRSSSNQVTGLSIWTSRLRGGLAFTKTK